jgi:predicted protein tyrosine phosphatase
MTKTEQIYEDHSPWDNPCQGTSKRVLFVCSAGMLRSPTAAVMGAQMGLNTRSCGSYTSALIPISSNLIQWAEIVVFMNIENYEGVKSLLKGKQVWVNLALKSRVWNIDDEYNYMDEGLKYILKTKLEELK